MVCALRWFGWRSSRGVSLFLARHHLHVNSRAPRVCFCRARDRKSWKHFNGGRGIDFCYTPNLEDEQAAPFYLLTHSARSPSALFVSGENKHCVYIYDSHVHMGCMDIFFSVRVCAAKNQPLISPLSSLKLSECCKNLCSKKSIERETPPDLLGWRVGMYICGVTGVSAIQMQQFSVRLSHECIKTINTNPVPPTRASDPVSVYIALARESVAAQPLESYVINS